MVKSSTRGQKSNTKKNKSSSDEDQNVNKNTNAYETFKKTKGGVQKN